jgi:hypothetical protein
MKTHPLNVSYLVVGLVFLGISGAWALREAGVVDTAQVGWLLPLMLVVAGGIGLVAFAAKGLTRRGEEAPTYPSYDEPGYPTYDEPATRTDLEGEDR